MQPENAFELYMLLRQESAAWLENHSRHFQRFLTIILAIMGAIFVAMTRIQEFDIALKLILCLAPLLNAVFGGIAIDACDRACRLYLECLGMQAKLEPMIGMTKLRTRHKGGSEDDFPFPDDRDLLPLRWLEDRRKFRTSAERTQAGLRLAANATARTTFTVLGVANVFLAGCVAWIVLYG